jgi:hypothetical protein
MGRSRSRCSSSTYLQLHCQLIIQLPAALLAVTRCAAVQQMLLLLPSTSPLCFCTQSCPFYRGQPCCNSTGTNMAAMLSRSGMRVFASAAKDNNKPRAFVNRVVPKASLNDAPKQFIETGAEAPMPTGSLSMTTTPFDNYAFAPIREATVSAAVLQMLLFVIVYKLPGVTGLCAA